MSSNVASALAASQRAVTFDTEKNYDAAVYYYKEAAKFLYLAVIGNEGTEEEKAERREKIKEYEARAAKLKDAGKPRSKPSLFISYGD